MTPDRLKFLWDDQSDLNALFRPDGPPRTSAGKVELAKEMVLHLISECGSLLDATGTWKVHRRDLPGPTLANRPAVGIELADIGKYWITICQIYGFSADEMSEAMRRKSMVVRQRHTEEWVQELDRPSVIVDLDMVLADYVTEFVRFLVHTRRCDDRQAESFLQNRTWIAAEHLNLTHTQYADVRHAFRVDGGFSRLPVMPGARGFLEWCVERGWQIILLTSRPIHDYPNVYSDTVLWLDTHHLPYDRIWWSRDKAYLCLERGVIDKIQFAVDDERQFVEQFARRNVRTYWMNPRPGDRQIVLEGSNTVAAHVIPVLNLRDIISHWEREHEQ